MAGLPQDFAWVPSDWFGGPAPAPDPAIPPPGAPPVDAAPIVNPALPEVGPAAPPAEQVFPPPDWLPQGAWSPDMTQPPVPDVTSGATQPAPTVEPQAPLQAVPAAQGQPGLGEQLFPFQAPETLQNALQGQPAAEPVDYDFGQPADQDRAAAEQLVEQGPEAVAAAGERQKLNREDYYNTQLLEHDRRNRQTAEKNALRWRNEEVDLGKERLALRQEAAELAKSGVNNDHWWASRTTGQKIGAYVAAIAGGLVSPYHGGRNSGLDLIQQAIAQDIETQKANLAHKRDVLGQRQGILGQLTQVNNDMLRSEETVRLAATENVLQRIEAEAARLDPRGAGAQRIALAIQNVRQQQQKDAVAADQKLFDRRKDVFEMRMRQEAVDEQRRARASAISEQRRGRDADMLIKGFRPDPKSPGGYAYDPSLLPQAGGADPQTRLAGLRGDKVESELQHEEEGRTVQYGDKTVGRARTKEEGTQSRARIANYLTHQEEMRELVNMISNPDGSTKKFYQGPGWQSVPNAERDAIMAKAFNVLYTQAKINDPSTGVKDFELQMTGKMLPFVQGLVGGRQPAEAARAVLEQSDNSLEKWLDSEVIGGVKNIPAAANPVGVARKSRAAADDARNEATSARTPEQGFDLLLAPIKAGTPDDARAEFVKAKGAVLDRWVRDTPWVLEELNAENIKQRWQRDPALSDAEKKQLGEALDAAVKKTEMARMVDPTGHLFRKQRAQVEDELDAEDEP